jgi:hypothetical protein
MNGAKQPDTAEDHMLIAMAGVPRWHAERKPRDAIAISHGADTLTWGGSNAAPTGAPAPCRQGRRAL